MLYVNALDYHFSHLGGLIFKFRLLVIAISFLVIGCGGPPQYIDESSESPAQLVLCSASTTDFAELLNGFSYQRTITLENQSRSVPADNIANLLLLNSPFAFVGGSFPGTGGTCSTTLIANAQCTLEISINPTAIGLISSPLSLSFYNGISDSTLDLNLVASVREPLPALLAITPVGNHDYGTVAIGGFSDALFTITNSGELSATSVNFSGLSSPFSVLSSNCASTIVAQETCQMTLRFTPLSQASFNQILSLSYQNGFSLQSLNKNVSGIGRVAGFLAIDEGLAFDFGLVNGGFVRNQIITLRNTGGGNATSISLNSLAAPLSVLSNTCPPVLTPAQSCSLTVRLSPTTTSSTDQNLIFSFFDGFNNQNTNINFQGEGFAETLTLSLISPLASPSNQSTPTIRVNSLVNGIRVRLYRNASCVTQVASTLSVGASLDFSPVMSEGTYQFHARAEDEYGNLSTCSTSLINYEYDNTNPNAPTNIILGSSFTSLGTVSPSFTWTLSSSTDVVDYQVGLSTLAAGGNATSGWTSKGNVNSSSQSGLSLAECSYYFVSVRSIDDVGLISTAHSVSGSSFRYDSSVPSAPSALSVSGDASDTNSATVSWTASTDTCGIQNYEVAISEDTNANNVLDASEVGNVRGFTNIGNIISHRFNGMNLNTGINHYTSIRAVDTTGRVSSVSVSSPWIIYNPSIELPNMIAWLDANDLTTLFDAQGDNANSGAFSGTVRTWNDKSGSAVAHHFSLSSGATEPAFDATRFSVDFNGTTTGLTTANHNEINLQTVNQRNITVAFTTSSDITSRQVLYEEGGNIRGMNIYINNGQLYCGFYNNIADIDGIQPFTWVNRAITTNRTYFVTWVFDYTNYTTPTGPDGSLNCYVDGVLFGSTPTTSRLFGHSGAVGLGHVNGQSCFEDASCPTSGAYFQGKIHEVMLFNNAPVLNDVINVHTYLDNKWN